MENPIPREQRQDVEGDASAFHEVITDIKKTFEGEDVSQEQLDQLLQRVTDLEKKVQGLSAVGNVLKPASELYPEKLREAKKKYPFQRECSRGCGKEVWVQYSVRKDKEYQTNSEDYKDFHNCGEQIPF